MSSFFLSGPVSFLSASWAQSQELDTIPEDLEAVHRLGDLLHRSAKTLGDVGDTPTIYASNVIMAIQVRIESSGRARDLDLSDLSVLGKELEVPVDGPQTDPREFPSDHPVELIRRGMAVHSLKLF
jgi:hypothetical protein